MPRGSAGLGVMAVLVLTAALPAQERKTSMETRPFGKTANGTPAELHTLKNSKGMTAKIMTYGGIITELHVPDRAGKLDDVVLGFDDLDGYLKGHPYFGAITGRVANRIAKGRFTLDGTEYKVATNNGPNALHGGKEGFDKKVWKAEPVKSADGPSLKLTYVSPDGEEGYPGTLTSMVTYTLTDKNELRIDYRATTDQPTPINLTNHTYFNLAGAKSSTDILGHAVRLVADKYTPTDATLIPTGKIDAVKGTPLDFTTPMPIGARIKQIKADPVGYDHNFVLNSGGGALALGAQVIEPKTGRTLEMYTTEPGVQFYTGNFLDGKLTGKGGVAYKQYGGFCLETQHFPDSINQPSFPPVVLRPGQTYTQTTVYKFLTD